MRPNSGSAADHDRRFWRRIALLAVGSVLSGLLGLVAASRYSNFGEFDSPGLLPAAPYIVAIALLTLLLAHLAEVDVNRVRDAAAALAVAMAPAALTVTEPHHSRIAITVIALATPGVGICVGTLGASLTAALPAFLATTGRELRVQRDEHAQPATSAGEYAASSLE